MPSVLSITVLQTGPITCLSYIYITLLFCIISLRRYLKSFHRGMSLGEYVDYLLVFLRTVKPKTGGNLKEASLATAAF